MLTACQRELLTFICRCIEEHGVAPSYDEMASALRLASKSTVNRLMSSLVERGYIRKIPRRARAIEVLRRPDGSSTLSTSLTAEEWKVVQYLRCNPSEFRRIALMA